MAGAYGSYELVIGLEVHAQLATASKIFCPCPAGAEPGKSVGELASNSRVCPICAGHPGALPVLNRRAVEYAIRTGLALGCRINRRNVFARKNYFYPDLPKGYQISQYEAPICEKGALAIRVGDAERRIGVTRAHLEEDAGKNLHMPGYSLVNLNRAGTPLIEIVSEPELRAPEEAGAYLRAMHSLVTFLGVCDGNMQEGNFRCDANVSVRVAGTEKFGTRVEIKNVNSFRFVEKAIDYEARRQIEVLTAGGRVVQETRGFDSQKGVTFSQRSKEEAQDYRYFPDPDLVTLQIDEAWVEKVRGEMPELPDARRARYVRDYGLSAQDADSVTGSPALARFFEGAAKDVGREGAKTAANLLTVEVARLANEAGVDVDGGALTPAHLGRAAGLVQDQTISNAGAKQALTAAWASGDKIDALVEKLGLRQVSDTAPIEAAVDKVIAAFPDQVAEYRSGKEKLAGFFVGKIMKETGGKANPAVVQSILKKKLAR